MSGFNTTLRVVLFLLIHLNPSLMSHKQLSKFPSLGVLTDAGGTGLTQTIDGVGSFIK